ncbi:MAG TPA: MEKHLA domain-containing protein [Methylothermaceae bacterium]|nr:MEKHLA domain-containing protein [Methylothermaceae bacterium]
MSFPEPAPANDFLAFHIERLRFSFRHWTGRELIDADLDPTSAARGLYHAPFALVSHGTEPDPVFNYANLTAQCLFGMDWQTFTQLPSRLSAEPPEQAQRRHLLEQVSRYGHISDYRGIRIAHNGRRFLIEGAVVWNVVDDRGNFYGQAACFEHWHFLNDGYTP